MSDTVLLAIISAVSALAVAVIGVYDRHQLVGQGITRTAGIAEDLAKANAS